MRICSVGMFTRLPSSLTPSQVIVSEKTDEQWKQHGCLGYVRDYTNQFYWDSNKPIETNIRIPIIQPVQSWNVGGFFRGSDEPKADLDAMKKDMEVIQDTVPCSGPMMDTWPVGNGNKLSQKRHVDFFCWWCHRSSKISNIALQSSVCPVKMHWYLGKNDSLFAAQKMWYCWWKKSYTTSTWDL